MEKQLNPSNLVKQLIAAIQQKTEMPAYRLTIGINATPTLFSSKLGGLPYWDLQKDYPLDHAGQKMMLLAQINFSEANLQDSRLPQTGMLQFFIATDDDLFGMDLDFGQLDSMKDYRVIYHETIDTNLTIAAVEALQLPIATDGREYTPLYKEVVLTITPTNIAMGPSCYLFDDLFRQTVLEVTGETLSDSQFYFNYLSDDDSEYLLQILRNERHWILGYPFFTQDDPRDYNETLRHYDTLLFQLDSDWINKTEYVLWGDAGVANFFINHDDLLKKDFSKIMYNWDCY